MKNILIIGAGDLGKEIVWLIEDINKRQPTYLILGFLDDDTTKSGTEFYGYKVLGGTEQLKELSLKYSFSAIIAIQDGRERKKIVEAHSEFDRWESIVHPTAVIASTSTVGKGSVIFPQVTVSVDSKLGCFGLYYIHSIICNDCRIGDYVSIMSGATVSEHVEIGDECFLAAGASVYPHKKLGKGSKVAIEATVKKDYEDGVKVGEKVASFF